MRPIEEVVKDLVIPAPVDTAYEKPGTFTVPQLDRKHDADQKAVNEAAVATWHNGQ